MKIIVFLVIFPVLLSVAGTAAAIAYQLNKELGYCVQLLDPDVTSVPVE